MVGRMGVYRGRLDASICGSVVGGLMILGGAGGGACAGPTPGSGAGASGAVSTGSVGGGGGTSSSDGGGAAAGGAGGSGPACGDGLLSPGEICFGTPAALLGTGVPTIVDVDGDGTLDLWLTPEGASPTLLLASAPGVFGAPTMGSGFDYPDVRDQAVGDWNGDGSADAIFTPLTGPFTLPIYFGNGQGAFATDPQAPVPGVTFTEGAIRAVGTAPAPNLDHDIVVAVAEASEGVEVRLDWADGAPQFHIENPFSGPTKLQAMAVATVNAAEGWEVRIGLALEAVSGSPSSSVVVARFDWDSEEFLSSMPVSTTGLFVDADFGDLDGDGEPELVLVGATDAVRIFDGPSYQAGAEKSLALPATAGDLRLRLADLDRDGIDELLVGSTGTVRYYFAGDEATLVGTDVSPVTGDLDRVFDVGDLNGDGHLDVVAQRQGGGTSVVLGEP